MSGIRERSGFVDSNDKLVVFIYLLGRDYLSLGQIEKIMRDITKHNFMIDFSLSPNKTYMFSNGWLAEYAKDVAERLKR